MIWHYRNIFLKSNSLLAKNKTTQLDLGIPIYNNAVN